jgi:hypothetical protein
MATIFQPPFWVPRPSDDPSWGYAARKSQLISLLTAAGKPKQFQPNFTYDDAAFWQGSPSHAAPIPLLTAIKFYGQGGQALPYKWNFTLDDPPSWQFFFIYNRNVAVPKVAVPFSNRQTYWYDEPSFWQGAPSDAAPIALLTQQKIYGQGGQVPPFRPNFTYDDPSFWLGKSDPSAIIPLLTAIKFFGQGGQVPPFRANFTYDDSSFWSWQYHVNSNILAGKAPSPASNYKTYFYSEDSLWTGAPKSNDLIVLLTAAKFYGQGGQSPTKTWHYDYDVGETTWWPFVERNVGIYRPTTAKPYRYNNWYYNYDMDAPGWGGSPLQANIIYLPKVTFHPWYSVYSNVVVDGQVS